MLAKLLVRHRERGVHVDVSDTTEARRYESAIDSDREVPKRETALDLDEFVLLLGQVETVQRRVEWFRDRVWFVRCERDLLPRGRSERTVLDVGTHR